MKLRRLCKSADSIPQGQCPAIYLAEDPTRMVGQGKHLDEATTNELFAAQLATGRTQTLVRVVVEPPTAYTAMELTVYPEFVEAGQDTRIVAVPEGQWPDGIPRFDYWLFDDHDVWRMHYDDDHRWVGAELLDADGAVADHLQWRDNALSQAVPLDVYISTRTG